MIHAEVGLLILSSAVEEPGLVLSLHQSAMKDESEDKSQNDGEKQILVDQDKPETSEKEIELQSYTDGVLDFSHSGMLINMDVNIHGSRTMFVYRSACHEGVPRKKFLVFAM